MKVESTLRKSIVLAGMLSMALPIVSCAKMKTAQAKLAALVRGQKSNDASSKPSSDGKEGVITYFEVKSGDLLDQVDLPGKLDSSERVEIRASQRMRVGPAKVKVGDHVKKGDVIFVVDTKEMDQKRVQAGERVAQLAVDIKNSKAQFSFAEKQLDRKKNLVNKGIAAQREFEEAEKSFVGAESDMKTKELEFRKAIRELEEAKTQVSSANVVASGEGIVSSVAPGGDDVNQGQALVVISNPTELVVSVPIDETTVTKFKTGQKVQVQVDALGSRMIDGVVRSIEASSKQDQGGAMSQYKLAVLISQPVVKANKLREGYSARVLATLGVRKNAILVPRAAVKYSGRDAYLLVSASKGKRPSVRQVKVGMLTALEAEILEGTRVGEFAGVVMEDEGGQP